MGNSIYDSATIFKCFLQIKLEQKYRRVILKHLMSILICVFTIGYHGKTVQMEKCSENHRTTIAYFLNQGKWDENILEQCVKAEVIRRIYGRYDCIENKAFVTGFASDRRCVFPPVTPEKEAGLWTSGGGRDVVV